MLYWIFGHNNRLDSIIIIFYSCVYLFSTRNKVIYVSFYGYNRSKYFFFFFCGTKLYFLCAMCWLLYAAFMNWKNVVLLFWWYDAWMIIMWYTFGLFSKSVMLFYFYFFLINLKGLFFMSFNRILFVDSVFFNDSKYCLLKNVCCCH